MMGQLSTTPPGMRAASLRLALFILLSAFGVFIGYLAFSQILRTLLWRELLPLNISLSVFLLTAFLSTAEVCIRSFRLWRTGQPPRASRLWGAAITSLLTASVAAVLASLGFLWL